ncbi:hypothetical protein ACHAAC_16770 [Aeromicrobium sp. CF4.19]|uniref:hypothetical protein n=1 Tax=Aeromicrobium sp. CF4.19 TaxID=3373082 RepID=UPI003EE7DFCF
MSALTDGDLDRIDVLSERIGVLTERRHEALEALDGHRSTPAGKWPDVHMFHGTITSLGSQIAAAEREVERLLGGERCG